MRKPIWASHKILSIVIYSALVYYYLRHQSSTDTGNDMTRWEDTVYLGFPLIGLLLVIFPSAIKLVALREDGYSPPEVFFALFGWVLLLAPIIALVLRLQA